VEAVGGRALLFPVGRRELLQDTSLDESLATLCVLKIPVVLGNISTYGKQFTYCADASIYPCSKNLAVRLLPYYGFSLAGMAVSIAAFAFLWRYGLEPPAYSAGQTTLFPRIPASATASSTKPTVRRVDGMLNASRWIVGTLAAGIAADYAYYAVVWFPNLLPRYSGSGHALNIRLFHRLARTRREPPARLHNKPTRNCPCPWSRVSAAAAVLPL
jgi:hypothetical protein